MNAHLKILALLLGTVSLAACGGSSGGNTDDDMEEMEEMEDDAMSRPSFDELAAALQATGDGIDLFGEDDLDPAAPSDVLVAGDATYSGQIAVLIGDSIDDPNVEDIDQSDILGEAHLDVAFTTTGGELSGTLDNFVGRDGVEYEGTVDIDEADLVVDADIVAVVTTLDGDITDPDGAITSVEGDLIGAFAEGDIFVGAAGGEVTSEEGTDEFLGIIVAAED